MTLVVEGLGINAVRCLWSGTTSLRYLRPRPLLICMIVTATFQLKFMDLLFAPNNEHVCDKAKTELGQWLAHVAPILQLAKRRCESLPVLKWFRDPNCELRKQFVDSISKAFEKSAGNGRLGAVNWCRCVSWSWKRKNNGWGRGLEVSWHLFKGCMVRQVVTELSRRFFQQVLDWRSLRTRVREWRTCAYMWTSGEARSIRKSWTITRVHNKLWNHVRA